MIRRRSPSLRAEILGWYSLVLVVALSLFAVTAYFLLQRALVTSEEESLRQAVDAVEQLANPDRIPRIDSVERFSVGVTSTGERIRMIHRQTVLLTGEVLTFYLPIGVVESRALRSFLFISLILIPVTAIVAGLGAGAFLERLLVPLRRLVETTREIGIGGLSRRVLEPDRPSDLQELAQSFNGMLMRLERAVDALRHFTADASHELRTPLTAIQGTIQVALSRPRSEDELREVLAEVMEETEWMLHLVDGLLTLARSEEGLASAEREIVDVSGLLEDSVEMGRLLASDKPIVVTLDTPRPLPTLGSAGQLRQVFLNLVSNAIKFTEAGTVAVTAREVEREDEGRWVEIRISDTGVGIAPDELDRVFDRFYRGDAARSTPGGTGLGLAIARLLVEQQGGTIDVQSRVGRGSEFRILLPRGDDAVARNGYGPSAEGIASG